MSPVFGRFAARRGMVAVAMFAVLVAATMSGSLPTKGPIPPQAFRLDGPLDASLLPDFVPALGRDGEVAGYVPKAYLIGPPGIMHTIGEPTDDEAPVYAEDLRTLVGHMVPDKGFVPLGVDPANVPAIPVEQGPAVATPPGPSTSLTLYVRTAAANTAWFAVVPADGGVRAQGAQGYYMDIGVGCLEVPIGGQLVLVDRPPQDAGPITLGVIYHRAGADTQPTLWVDIAADGTVGQGAGVPPWWTGPPPAC